MSGRALPPIIGESAAMKRAIALIDRFAPTTLSILLVGATGTGKELMARHIHERSGRQGDLVDVNCGALPHDMVESLLFGHRRGAFTGAIETAVGHIERANRGTLLLDEVLHLSVGAQVKLLRVLETNEVQPLGEARKRTVDLRIVAAAQEDTCERLQTGAFRRDVYQRLAGVVINLPALVDRPEDLVPLAAHFAEHQGQVLEPGTRRVLNNYSWPGNVRELRLAIQRAGCLVPNGTVPAAALLEAIEMGAPLDALPMGLSRDASIRDAIYALDVNNWDTRRAAAALGIGRSTLYDRLSAAGVSVRRLKKERSVGILRNPSEVR